MRLLDVNSLDLKNDTGHPQMKEFIGKNIPPYAILSHTWGGDEARCTLLVSQASGIDKAYVRLGNDADYVARRHRRILDASVTTRMSWAARHHTTREEGEAYYIAEAYEGRCRRRIQDASVATRMSWAAKRHTTREEDEAYCLLGLFEVNMPLLYGEGKNGFIRLQEEIIRRSDDMSIFCWHYGVFRMGRSTRHAGLLALEPKHFSNSSAAEASPSRRHWLSAPFEVTNKGLKVELSLIEVGENLYFSVLECNNQDFRLHRQANRLIDGTASSPVCIVLKRAHKGGNKFFRVFPDRVIHINDLQGIRETCFVQQRPGHFRIQQTPNHFRINDSWLNNTGLSLSSIQIHAGEPFQQEWVLLGLWKRCNTSCRHQRIRAGPSLYARCSRACEWVNTIPSHTGGWKESISRELPVHERSHAAAIVLEHRKSSLVIAIFFSRDHGERSYATELRVSSFSLFKRADQLIESKFALEVRVIKYEARPTGISRTRLRAGSIWGYRTAGQVQQDISLCYTLELRARQDSDQVLQNLSRVHHIKPLENEELERLFEKSLQDSTTPTIISPWWNGSVARLTFEYLKRVGARRETASKSGKLTKCWLLAVLLGLAIPLLVLGGFAKRTP